MEELKKIGLFADLSDTDELLLNYIKKLDDRFDFESLVLVHFVAMEEVPKNISDLLPEIDQPLEKILKEELEELVIKVFGEKKESISIYVYGGGKLEEFIPWVDKQFDLVIFGKKSPYHGTGRLSSKIVRLTKCSTLFLPETAKPSIQKIIVPLDFSFYSVQAVKAARFIQEITGAELIFVHVLKVGIQYFPYIRNRENLKEELQKKAFRQFEKIKAKEKLIAEIIFLSESEQPVSRIIYDYAIHNGVDLIIAGVKGKTDDDQLLIGSVAERLIASDKYLPIMIVK